MGRAVVVARGRRGGGGASGPVRGAGVSSIVPNKANLCRFWAGNEDGRKSKANSPDFVRSREMRSSTCEIRDKSEIQGVQMITNAPNKANCRRFWAGNGGWGGKQSQFDRLQAKPGNPEHEARNSKQMPGTKWTMTQARPPGGRGDWDIGFGVVWEAMGGRIGNSGRLGHEPGLFRGCLLVAYGLKSRVCNDDFERIDDET